MSQITYASPLGELTLTANRDGLTGLYLPKRAPQPVNASSHSAQRVLDEACRQLDGYFNGKRYKRFRMGKRPAIRPFPPLLVTQKPTKR